MDGSDLCGVCEIVIEAENWNGCCELDGHEIESESLLILQVASSPIPEKKNSLRSIGFESNSFIAWQTGSLSPPPKCVASVQGASVLSSPWAFTIGWQLAGN